MPVAVSRGRVDRFASLVLLPTQQILDFLLQEILNPVLNLPTDVRFEMLVDDL
jgi:hypothetical protein